MVVVADLAGQNVILEPDPEYVNKELKILRKDDNGIPISEINFGSHSNNAIRFGVPDVPGVHSGQEYMRIHTNGDIGIGKLPGSGIKLDVDGAINATSFNGRDVSADGTTLDNHVTNTSNPHNTTATQVGALSLAGGTINGNLYINGNVGIGTAPTRKLEIAGSSGNVLWAGASTGSTANIDLSGHVQLREYGTDGIAYLQARDDNSNRDIALRIRTQAARIVPLQARDDNSNRDIALRNRTQAAFILKPIIIDALTIDSSGNVGIGTTEPSEKLEVRGNIKISGEIKQDPWIRPTLKNSWVEYDPGLYNPPGYFRDKNGIVHLRGMVKNGAIKSTIFTLPPGFCPEYRELQPVQTYNAIGRIDIATDGQVIAYVGDNKWFSLDGITFRAINY